MSEGGDYQPGERRPIASRSLGWVQAIAGWLARSGVSPNAISTSSTMFAALGAAALASTAHVGPGADRALWVLAALGIQLRLLANLFDGMVALQTKRASPVGELFNEVPDRISDALLLVSAGFAPASSPHLGFAAALLAVFVAYVRAMGGVVGAGQIFAGVMAKPQRMFWLTVLCLFEGLAPDALRAPFFGPLGVPACVLALICFGCVVTAWTRLTAIAGKLRSR